MKRRRNDSADAEAICEAVMRATMRFVPAKSAKQQSALVLHRSRDLLIRQRTMLTGHFAELGIVVPQGLRTLSKLIEVAFDEEDTPIPVLARYTLRALVAQIQELQGRIKELEKDLLAWHRKSQTSRRLETIPGASATAWNHVEFSRSTPFETPSQMRCLNTRLNAILTTSSNSSCIRSRKEG